MHQSPITDRIFATEAGHLPLLPVDRLGRVERRSRLRFPISLSVTYGSIANGRHVCGSGQTLNVSSNGMLIKSEQPFDPKLRLGTRLKVIAIWPFWLNECAGLKLVAIGRVKRRYESSFALSIEYHEFRAIRQTMRKTA